MSLWCPFRPPSNLSSWGRSHSKKTRKTPSRLLMESDQLLRKAGVILDIVLDAY